MLSVFSEEWPLLLFTLLAQLAIGSYIFIIFIRTFKKDVDQKKSVEITTKGMILVGPVMLASLILSVYHLGAPLIAYFSISNIATSWLSREILFAGTFFILWIATYLLDRAGKDSLILGWITSLVGLVTIYSMGSIYTSTIIPAWTDINTYIGFYGTTIIFGSVTSMILLLNKESVSPRYKSILKTIGLIGLASVIIQLIYLPIYYAGLGVNGGAMGVASATLMSNYYALTNVIRWSLSILALMFVGYMFIKKTPINNKYGLYYLPIILVITGEFLGRLIFYAAGLQ